MTYFIKRSKPFALSSGDALVVRNILSILQHKLFHFVQPPKDILTNDTLNFILLSNLFKLNFNMWLVY